MKKLIVLVMGLLLLSCNEAKKEGFTLNGTLQNAKNGTKIVLLPFAKYQTKPEFETTIENGTFRLEGNVPEPRMYHLVVGDKDDFYFVMIENSEMELTGNLDEISSNNDNKTSYKFDDIKISGSESNDYFYEQYSFRDALNNQHTKISEDYKDVSKMLGEARVSKNKEKMDSIMQLERYKAYAKAEKDFFTAVEQGYVKVIEANKETFWGPLMMLTLYSYFTPEQRPDFEKMSKVAQESYYGKMLEKELYPVNRAGEKVPDFTTIDQEGNKYALNDLIKDKKVVLIDFWASWCAPCRKELPNVKSNYEKYAEQGFEVIGISIDKDPKAWKKALKDEQMPWPNFNDNEVAALYKVSSIPATYLIDGNGKLIADNIRGEELGIKLSEILDNKSQE